MTQDIAAGTNSHSLVDTNSDNLGNVTPKNATGRVAMNQVIFKNEI